MPVPEAELRAIFAQLVNEKDPEMREQLLRRAKAKSIANTIDEFNRAHKAGELIALKKKPRRSKDAAP